MGESRTHILNVEVDDLDVIQDTIADSLEAAPTAEAWTAIVCGLPGDGTLMVADWIVLACRAQGLDVVATSLGGADSDPHGMLISVGVEPDSIPGGPVDLIICGEHLELVRAVRSGYASADRTSIVASSIRAFTSVEERVAPQHVLSEDEIDELATNSAKRYVAFNGPEVASWYRLSGRAQSALLFGAACGTGERVLDVAAGRHAITQLGIAVAQNRAAFEKGLRFGRRAGGRIKRELTAAQFVRKRRGLLPRNERVLFEQLIESIDARFDAAHRNVLREAVYVLTEFESAQYAAYLLEQCDIVAREEDAMCASSQLRVAPTQSVVPNVARNLTAILAYLDLARLAQLKLRRKRLPEIRKQHGVSRLDAYQLRDRITVDSLDMPQSLFTRIRGRANSVDVATRLPAHRARTYIVHTTSIIGALRMRKWAGSRRGRVNTVRHQVETSAAHAYITALRDALQTGNHRLVAIVADSGVLVSGFGAARVANRASALSFWGQVVRPSIMVDRTSGNEDFAMSELVIAHVHSQLCRSGQLALWEFAGQVLGIAMHVSRGGSFEQAMERAQELCGIAPISDHKPPVSPYEVVDSDDLGDDAVELELDSVDHIDGTLE